MLGARFVLVFSALAAACSSPTAEPPPTEPPELTVSVSCGRNEDTQTLAIAVANLGRSPAAPSAARVEFNGDPAAAVTRRTRVIAAHAVDTFEVEMPSDCSKIACRWDVTIDSARKVHESGRC